MLVAYVDVARVLVALGRLMTLYSGQSCSDRPTDLIDFVLDTLRVLEADHEAHVIEATDALQSPRVFVPLVHCGDQVGPRLAQTVVNVGAMRGQTGFVPILTGLVSLKRSIRIDCPFEVSMLLRASRTYVIRAPASFPHISLVPSHQGQVKRCSLPFPTLKIVCVLLENQPERPTQQECEIELETPHDLR